MTLLATLPGQATLLDAVVAAVVSAGQHNPNDTLAPAVILWPDKERQWVPILPALRERLPLLTLGPYDPETWTGPAYWLRCAIAGVLEGVTIPVGSPPVIYLPGVSRADLRAVESCPKALQPLAELQYRGVIWSHRNGRDWTVAGFLKNPDARLEIAVQGDAATEAALLTGLRRLAQEPLVSLRDVQPLRAAYIHELLNPDAARRLLRWLNDPEQERQTFAPEEWQAFVATCQATYGFNPERDGPIGATHKLGERKGSWQPLWDAFAEMPGRYPGIAARLAQAQPFQPRLIGETTIWGGADDPRSSWPGQNQHAEGVLRDGLRSLAEKTAAEARADLLQLEAEHAGRRQWVWATIGQSPLAAALAPLAELATRARQPLSGETTAGVTHAYAAEGWRTDDAFLRALASVADASPDDTEAVLAAADVVYRPWLDLAATRFQDVVLNARDGPIDYAPALPLTAEAGTCLIFVDGLRFDLGQELAETLDAMDYETSIDSRLAALPTVTPTAKPAVTPVADQLAGGDDFATIVAADGRKVTAALLGKLMSEAGYEILSGSDLGEPSGRAWTEEGQIDAYGHGHGWMVARHGRDEVVRLAGRIRQLLGWGWQEIVVITDHGWLLLPGKLPTAELPAHLTDVRKGRCARLKDGAQTDEATVPWHWDATVRVAVARGIRCYEAGKVYEHGGLSPQECITPIIRVRASATAAPVYLQNLRWRGLRCNVTLSGATSGMLIDLRLSPADPATSVADSIKVPDPDGTATLFLDGERDDLAGAEAFVTVTAPDGTVLAQQQTTIGS